MSKKNTGMSLIEVLAALLLFSVAILGFVALQARATQYSVDAEDRARAALLANELVTSMWLQGTSTPSDLDTWKTKVQNPAAGGLPVPATAPPTVAPDTTNPEITVITIQWKSPSKKTAGNSKYVTTVVIP